MEKLHGVYMAEILATLEREEVVSIPLKFAKARVAAMRLENRGEIVRVFQDKDAIVYSLPDFPSDCA